MYSSAFLAQKAGFAKNLHFFQKIRIFVLHLYALWRILYIDEPGSPANKKVKIENRKGRKMAGYNGYSKSNNAIDAERDYKYPKSTAKRLLGLKDSAFGSPCEWHHTSMWYNRTDYYDLRDLIVRQTLREHSTARPNAEQLLMRARVRRMLAEELAPARSLVKPESESPIMAQMMAAARQYRDAIEAKSRAKSAAAVAERQAHVEAERAAAAADYDAQLRRRCVCNGITKERIAAALAGAELENKTGLYAQIRAWFRGREDRAMEYAVC